MQENCPVACGMCFKNKILPNSFTKAIKSSTELSFSIKKQNGCEDLRVDCAELAKRRYCITAQTFTKTYCARSCGFCFVPPVTEISELAKPIISAITNKKIDTNLYISTKIPMVTFWPSLRRLTKQSSTSTLNSNNINDCKDQKRFCGVWKKSGFCQGIFTNYMKKNCALTCDWCKTI